MAIKEAGYTRILDYAGVSTWDYGITVSGPESHVRPGRVYETVSVPGRSGDIKIDQGRYENVKIAYSCLIHEGPGFTESAQERYDLFCAKLLSKTGYNTLIDSKETIIKGTPWVYPPDWVRNACIDGGISPELAWNGVAYEFALNFDCEPFRVAYMTSSESCTATTDVQSSTRSDAVGARPYLTINTLPAYTTLIVAGMSLVNSTGTDWSNVHIDTKSRTIYCNNYTYGSTVEATLLDAVLAYDPMIGDTIEYRAVFGSSATATSVTFNLNHRWFTI